MKTKRRVILLSLLLSAFLSSMIAFTATAFADSKHVTLNEPVTVGNIVLKPGTYLVVWSGDGPLVAVSFIRGNKTIATASATLSLEKSPSRKIVTITLPDNSRTLKQLVFSSKSLLFDMSNGPGVS